MAITLNVPPEADAQQSCVLRNRDGGPIGISSVTPSDAAIRVSLQEHPAAGTCVITATIPAGYQTRGKDGEEILVRTDLPDAPLIRIPVLVWPGQSQPANIGWLYHARELIGHPPPRMQLEDLGGKPVEVSVPEGKVAVLMFVADWCGHCDLQVPILERVRKDYVDRKVSDLNFYAICPMLGNSQMAVEAVRRWGLHGLITMDRNGKAAQQYGVKAYPVIFLVGRDRTVQAVHGRYSNDPTGNGLDTLEADLHTEIDILLTGGTREDFPPPIPATRPAVATRPALPDQPVLNVQPEYRIENCRPGAKANVAVIVCNHGLKPLKLLKVMPAAKVKLNPGYVKEVPGGGLVVVRCELTAPAAAGPFGRTIRIECDDPRQPVAEVKLAGTVALGEEATACG